MNACVIVILIHSVTTKSNSDAADARVIAASTLIAPQNVTRVIVGERKSYVEVILIFGSGANGEYC